MIYIGLDIGSTAVKAAAVDDRGNIVSRGKCRYSTKTTPDGGSLQNPADWWSCAVTALRGAVSGLRSPGDVAGISLSSQGGSIFALDGQYRLLCDAMTWMDRRSGVEAQLISEHFGDEVYNNCGWATSAVDCSAKLLWMSKNTPEVFSRAAYFFTTQEYITYKLTGRAVTDPTGAAISRLYSIKRGDFNYELLDFIGVRREQLAAVRPCGEKLGVLCHGAATELGLGDNVAVYNGAHDQYCASIGSGVSRVGDTLLATGTAWVIFGISDRLIFNDRHPAPGVHPAGGGYGIMASLSGIGAAMENCADKIGGSLAQIDDEAQKRVGSAADILMCPCPPGRSFVTHRENTLGAVCGVGRATDCYDCARALMEGAAFEVRVALRELKRAGMSMDGSLTMSGGAAKSNLWSGIVSTVCDRDILLTDEADTPALGAAMIAAVCGGAYAGYGECAAALVKKSIVTPNSTLTEFYDEKFRRYCEWCIY